MSKNFQNIFLVGPMGAGKSTIGRFIAEQLQRDFFDTDHEIEKRTGVNIAWILDVEGEIGFAQRETLVLDNLTQKTGIVLATGGGSILTAENRRILAARGYVIYLKASLEQQEERTDRDQRRPQLEGVDDLLGTLKTFDSTRTPLYESIADAAFITDQASARTVADNIVKSLRETGIV